MTAVVEARTARIALIGAGGIGKAHAQAVGRLEAASLVAVADTNVDAAGAVAAEHGARVADVADLADRSAVDLVVVASPPATHPDVVEPLLRAGVPVLCEKPIAVDRVSAQRLAAVAAETGTPLSMATKFRFVGDVAAARSMIADGRLGDVLKIEVAFAGRVEMVSRWNSDPRIAGGGVLIDNATHGIDLVRHLVGDVEQVLAVAGPAGQSLEVEDSATLLLRTVSGTLAQIDVTWSFRRISPVFCSIHGTSGAVEIGWGGGTAVLADEPAPIRLESGYDKITSLRDNLAAVLTALATDSPLPVGADDAVAAAAVVDAGYASLASGRWTPVEAGR